MRLLFLILRWLINVVGILSLVSWLIAVGFTITWLPFDWSDINSIQFVIGSSLLILYFVLGGLKIIFISAKILRNVISIIFTIIGIGSLILSTYNSGMWLTTNHAWLDYSNIQYAEVYLSIFSISIILISSYVLFGSYVLLKISKENQYRSC